MTSTFFLVLCPPGAEKALVADVAHAGLRLAFSRPGFVTLKADHALGPEERVPSPLVRFGAPCFGRAGELVDDVIALAKDLGSPVRVHVVASSAMVEADAVARVKKTVVEALGARALPDAPPAPGEAVLTVVLVDDAVWLALHKHTVGDAGTPGARPSRAMPEDAPSRAWAKIEEAFERFGLSPAEGERALEIGAAPGGAVRALLDRGLHVVGVDPNAMDPKVAEHPRFLHVATPSTKLEPGQIAGPFQWILVDVNVPPGTALRGALPFIAAHAGTLRGVVFTLKLKSWDMLAEGPGWLSRLRHAAPQLDFTAGSLWSHGQEIVAVGRARGVSRGR